jgi:hypothetical protein
MSRTMPATAAERARGFYAVVNDRGLRAVCWLRRVSVRAIAPRQPDP